VRVGVITYSYRGGNINTAEETLKALLEDGLSEVVLMDGPTRTTTRTRVLPVIGKAEDLKNFKPSASLCWRRL
jgi:hypothetical protein